MKLYLELFDVTTMKKFKKCFKSEYEMDKFLKKLSYSRKLMIVKDSRDSYIIGFGGLKRL